MKSRLLFCLLMIPALSFGQSQYFPLPAYFGTNVFLHDNTNTPLHLRVPTNAVLTGVTSTNGSATITTNGTVVDIAVPTNSVGTYENITGSRISLGLPLTNNISNSATGAMQAIGNITFLGGGGFNTNGSPVILENAFGAVQRGEFKGATAIINTSAVGAVQSGSFSGFAVGVDWYGAYAEISPFASGAEQSGLFGGGRMVIGYSAAGAVQRGYLANQTTYWATNQGAASIQLFYHDGSMGSASNSFTSGRASILLGPGRQTNDFGLMAAGPIQTRSGFIGNAEGLTNFPSSIQTVPAFNTWSTNAVKYEVATGSATNLFIILGGTNRFRITGVLNP